MLMLLLLLWEERFEANCEPIFSNELCFSKSVTIYNNYNIVIDKLVC